MWTKQGWVALSLTERLHEMCIVFYAQFMLPEMGGSQLLSTRVKVGALVVTAKLYSI